MMEVHEQTQTVLGMWVTDLVADFDIYQQISLTLVPLAGPTP